VGDNADEAVRMLEQNGFLCGELAAGGWTYADPRIVRMISCRREIERAIVRVTTIYTNLGLNAEGEIQHIR
jgi:hypothetical protein